jgi:ribosome modulation factor
MSDATGSIRLAIEPKARQQGYVAGRRGLGCVANPYPTHTAEAQDWQLGWRYGQTKPLRLVPADGYVDP